MELPVNHFKRAIEAGRLQIGLWNSLCSATATEILADAGFDWLLIDVEHTPNDVANVLGQLQAMAAGAVEGVDGIFIGPSDLSADLGHLGNSSHPEVRETIEDAVARILAAGKPPGILTGVEDDAHHWVKQGCVFVAVGSDVGVLARQSEALASRFKQSS